MVGIVWLHFHMVSGGNKLLNIFPLCSASPFPSPSYPTRSQSEYLQPSFPSFWKLCGIWLFGHQH